MCHCDSQIRQTKNEVGTFGGCIRRQKHETGAEAGPYGYPVMLEWMPRRRWSRQRLSGRGVPKCRYRHAAEGSASRLALDECLKRLLRPSRGSDKGQTRT